MIKHRSNIRSAMFALAAMTGISSFAAPRRTGMSNHRPDLLILDERSRFRNVTRPPSNGARECARRVKQMANGMHREGAVA